MQTNSWGLHYPVFPVQKVIKGSVFLACSDSCPVHHHAMTCCAEVDCGQWNIWEWTRRWDRDVKPLISTQNMYYFMEIHFYKYKYTIELCHKFIVFVFIMFIHLQFFCGINFCDSNALRGFCDSRESCDFINRANLNMA